MTKKSKPDNAPIQNFRHLLIESLETRRVLADAFWIGSAGDNVFENPDNWSPATVPTAADVAMFTGDGDLVQLYWDHTVAKVQATSGSTVLDLRSRTLQVNDSLLVRGGQLNVDNSGMSFDTAHIVGPPPDPNFPMSGPVAELRVEGNGVLSLDGEFGGEILVSAGDFVVGDSGSGEVIIQPGAELRSGSAAIGENDSGSVVVGDAAGEIVTGTWTVAGDAVIGESGAGTLVVGDAGEVVIDDSLVLGLNQNGTGTATVDNRLTVKGQMIVGDKGGAELRIIDEPPGGYAVMANGAVLGKTNTNGATEGAVFVIDGSWAVANEGVGAGPVPQPLTIGKAGKAQLQASDKSFIESGVTVVGDEATAKARVGVHEESKWVVVGGLIIGKKADGVEFVVDGMSWVEVTQAIEIGKGTPANYGANGNLTEVTLSTGGELTSVSGTIHIGDGGAGTIVEIHQGALLRSGSVGGVDQSINFTTGEMVLLGTLQAGSGNGWIENTSGVIIEHASGEIKGLVRNQGNVKATGNIIGALENSGKYYPGFEALVGISNIEGYFLGLDDGTVFVDIFGPGNHDEVRVVGDVTLGGTLDGTVSYAPEPWTLEGIAGDHFAVITATGSLSGEFDPLSGLNLPDPASLGLPTPPPGRSYVWKVVYETDPDLAPYGQLPWTTNGTQDVVLLILETTEPELVAGAAGPIGTNSIAAEFRIENQDAPADFDVEVFVDAGGTPGTLLGGALFGAGTPANDPYDPDDVTTAAINIDSSTLTGSESLLVWVDSGYDLDGNPVGQIDEASESNNTLILPPIQVDDVSVAEDSGSLEFTVELLQASTETVTVEYETQPDSAGAHPATGDDDFWHTYGTLTFESGDTKQPISVSLDDDNLYEYDETFLLRLYDPVNAFFYDDTNQVVDETTAVGTITDASDQPSITIADAAVDEDGGAAWFTVELSNPTDRMITVDYATDDDSATAPDDYLSATGTATFNGGGDPYQHVAVDIVDDNVDEPDETFFVNLSNATDGTIDLTIGDDQAVGTIYDNDVPWVRIDDVTVDEAAGNAVFTVGLVDASGASTLGVEDAIVYYYTWDDSGWDPYAASQPDDYTYTQDSATIPAGSSSGSISIPIVDDTMDEFDEVFHVALYSAENAQIEDDDGEATILDNDPEPSLSINDASGSEIDGYIEFTVTLSEVSGRDVTVDFTTADGTATAPDDYSDYGYYGLTFYPGDLTQTVLIDLNPDGWDEYPETFYVNLVNPSGATLADDQGLGTIIDSDVPEISVEDGWFYEFDGTGTFYLSLSVPSDKTITVDYATADDTAVSPDDYAATSGTITFAPGEWEQQLHVTLVDDGIDEYDEQFFVNLSNPVEATIGDSQAYGVIYGELYLTLDLPPNEPAEPLPPLTLAEVKPLVPEAVARWVAAGSDGKQLRAALANVEFVIMDLPDSRLSAAHNGRILLDVDAAGYGWFVDATPGDDKEFERVVSPSERQAGDGSPAAGRVDLLTAITHELGHLLGLPDLPVDLVPHNIMTDTIGLATRRSPVRHQAAPDRTDVLPGPRRTTDAVFHQVGRHRELRSNEAEGDTGFAPADRLWTEEEFVLFVYEFLSNDRVR